ncbi:unnamed protein product [Discula destructiva]
MRTIPRSVELLLSTPRRGLHPRVHNKTHPSVLHLHPYRRSRSLTTSPSSSPRTCATRTPDGFHGRANSCRGGFARHINHQHYVPQSSTEPGARNYNAQVKALLAALRQNDTLKLYFCLLDLTRGASLDHAPFCRAVQSIPPTTFSEILRSFDPFHVSQCVDSAPGLPISWGAAIHTPLGELINKWGVKILYVRIFTRLRLVQRARRQPMFDPGDSSLPIRPLLHDYLVLLRCAGATSNITAAKTIWYELAADGYALWKHSELFAEFVKARYLTEPLYANNDLARFRLQPLDMHRSATVLTRQQVRELSHLRAKLLNKHSHRFGQNVQEIFFAEPLTRLLRKRKPLARLQRRAMLRHMVPGDESLLCAILKANGRNGQVYASNVLMRFWGINISNFRSEIGQREISGGHDFAPGAAQAPTEALLDAVVHCYGNMGEISLASALVDFISRRWNIPVPDNVWSDLLAFARIHSTDPAAREWRIAGMSNKITRPGMVVKIWWQCTQEPHNFQPSMKDYYCLVKSILRPMAPLTRSLDALRQLTPLYHQTVRQMQDAWAELILTTQQGVSNHAAYRRYRMLQASKHYIWHCFHYTSRQIFHSLKPAHVQDHNAVRLMPDIVAELGPFMTKTIQYRIATGVVDLHLDNAPLQTVTSKQTLQRPEPLLHRLSVQREAGDDSRFPRHGLQDTYERAPSSFVDSVVSQGSLSQGATSAILQEYMHISGIGGLQQDRQHEMDDSMEGDVEDGDEEQDEHMLVDRVVKMQTNQDKGVDGKDMTAHVYETNERGEYGVVESSSSEQRLQDTFNESQNLGHDFSADSKGVDNYSERGVSSAGDAFEDVFASSIHHGADFSTQQHSDDWEKAETEILNNVKFTSRRSESRQLLDRPAFMMRPRYSAPPGELSLSGLRQDGKDFTGFHQDQLKKHYAAHRTIREMRHAPGVPVDLTGVAASQRQLMKHLLLVRT